MIVICLKIGVSCKYDRIGQLFDMMKDMRALKYKKYDMRLISAYELESLKE